MIDGKSSLTPDRVRREAVKRRRQQVRRQRRILGVVVLVVLLGVAGGFTILPRLLHAQVPAPKQSARQPESQPRSAEPTATSGPPPTPASPSPTYTLTLDVSENPQASVTPASLAVAADKQPVKLPYASWEGKRFVGWFTGPADDKNATCIDNSTLDLIPKNANTTLYARFEKAPQGVDRKTPGLPVLMYHDFYDPDQGEKAGKNEPANHLNIKTFRTQLAWLKDNHYYFPDWNEVLAFVQGKIRLPAKSVVLTSDDGAPGFFRLAIPAVKQSQAYMTGFIIGSYAQSDKIDFSQYDPTYVAFGSHSYNLHVGNAKGDGAITTATNDQITQDVEREAQVIGPNFVFCYPFGRTGRDYTMRVEKDLIADGYQLAFTVTQGRVYPGMNPMELPRLRVSEPCSAAAFHSLVHVSAP